MESLLLILGIEWLGGNWEIQLELMECKFNEVIWIEADVSLTAGL